MSEETQGIDNTAAVMQGDDEAIFVAANIEDNHGTAAFGFYRVGGGINAADIYEVLPTGGADTFSPRIQPFSGLRKARRETLESELLDDPRGYNMYSFIRRGQRHVDAFFPPKSAKCRTTDGEKQAEAGGRTDVRNPHRAACNFKPSATMDILIGIGAMALAGLIGLIVYRNLPTV